MPKSNVRGGKHHKKGKKKRVEPSSNILILAQEGQIYCYVKKKIGGSRILVDCSDGKSRSAVIPGKFFRKIWLNPGDVLLCELNVNNDDTICYVSHKYTPRDASNLKKQGLIDFDVVYEEEISDIIISEEKNDEYWELSEENQGLEEEDSSIDNEMNISTL